MRVQINKKVSQGPYEICLREVYFSSERATYLLVNIKNIGTDAIKLLAGVKGKKALSKWIQFEVNNKSINAEYISPSNPFQYGVLLPNEEIEVEILFSILPKSIIRNIKKISFSLFLKQSPKGEVTKLTVETNKKPISIEPNEFLLDRFHPRYMHDFLSYGGFILLGLIVIGIVSLLIPIFPLSYFVLAVIAVPIIIRCINLNINLLSLTENLEERAMLKKKERNII